VQIDASEPEIFERLLAQAVDEQVARRAGAQVAPRDLFEQILQLFV
jgi:hypothetical protein